MADVKNICGYDVKDASARSACSSLDTRVTALEEAGSVLYADSPIGTIMAFGGGSNSIPSEWLFCDGSAINRATYADLFAVIGTNFGVGDGSTTFNLPDLRESVPKGAGLTSKSSNHMSAGGLALGEFINDRVQEHYHYDKVSSGASGGNAAGGTSVTSPLYEVSIGRVANSGRKGDTTEVKAVGVNYIIKAKQATLPIDVQSALNTKQNITDNNLDTTAKTVIGAINEINSTVTKHEIDTAVDLWNYTSTEYTTPSDGYVQGVNDGVANSRVNIYVNGYQMAILRSSSTPNFPSAMSMFVKKGMRLRHDSSDASGGAFRFIPIVS